MFIPRNTFNYVYLLLLFEKAEKLKVSGGKKELALVVYNVCCAG